MELIESIDKQREIEDDSGENGINQASKPQSQNSKIFKGLTPTAIYNHFNASTLDKEICHGILFSLLHPNGAYCPFCKIEIRDTNTLQNFYNLKRCRCKNCSKWFSATTKTILQGSHFNFRELFLLAIFLKLNLSDKEISNKLNIHPTSVRLWRIKFALLEEQ